MVWAVGERIWAAHEATQLVEQGEVVLGQVQGPLGLLPVQLLGLLEVLQVLVVRPDLDRGCAPSRKCHHSSRARTITSISLSWIT
jgi:hypothetical protein